MANYIFETMSAADAANFTSSDRLTFSTTPLDGISGGLDEAANRLSLSRFDFSSGQPVRQTLTFDLSDFAEAPISFTTGNARLYYGTPGDDVIHIENGASRVVASGLSGNDLIEGSDLGERLAGGTGRDTIRGNGGDDELVAFDAMGDYLDGGAGNDALSGGIGNDTLVGGAGNDGFSDSRGSDMWIGGPGDDGFSWIPEQPMPTIVENPDEGYDSIGVYGQDYTLPDNIERLVSGGTAGARLTGNALDNFIRGSNLGSDLISGGQGNDELQGGGGADTVIGGAGNDTLTGGDLNSVLNGGEGDDLLLPFSFMSGVYNGGEGTDTIRIFNGANLVDSQIQSIERFELASEPFSSSELTISVDQLASLVASATFVGGLGNDLVTISAFAAGSYQLPNLTLSNWNPGLGQFLSAVSFIPRTQGDSVFLNGEQAVNYILRTAAVHSGVQGLMGNAGNDQLIGGDGVNLLIGNAGNDTIDGAAGDDRMSGGAGSDQLDGGDGNDTLVGDAGNDQARGGSGADQIDGREGDDLLEGGTGDDDLLGREGADQLDGNDGNDTIDGGADNDRVAGGAGADRLNGDEGHDDLTGGDGADTLAGGNGNDHLYGQSANGGPDEADNITGGDGSDYLQGNAGNDTLDGGTGSDRINGGANDDRIFGNSGNDSINGNLGNDTIDGGADNDSLRGGQGNDSITGGTGNDSLSGDLGSDTLSGGAGNDLFTFAGAASPAATPDRINDYAAGTDRLSLGFTPATVLTGSAQTTLPDATTLAQQLFDGRAGDQEVAAIAVGSDTYIFYSSAVGGTVDSGILLVGVSPSAIGSSDFG